LSQGSLIKLLTTADFLLKKKKGIYIPVCAKESVIITDTVKAESDVIGW
jgi:hypothetical protein